MYALSDDLVHWSAPRMLYQPRCSGGGGDGAPFYQEIYPSLMDPASPSDNFDVVGERPYLYFVAFHDNLPAPPPATGGVTVVRDVRRVPLQLVL